jgi:hypothetical protein
LLSALLKLRIHVFKTLARLCVHLLPKQWHQKALEFLALYKSDFPISIVDQLKDVLPVKQSGKDEATQPSELLVRL